MKVNAGLMAIILSILFNINNSYSQYTHYEGQTQATINGSKTDIGFLAGMGAQYYTTDFISLQFNLGYEWGRPHQAYYKSYNLDFGMTYTPVELGRSFYLNLKALASVAAQKVTDNALISASTFNYGGKIGGGLEYYIDDRTALELSGLQGFYAKKTLGQKQYEVGLTIKININ